MYNNTPHSLYGSFYKILVPPSFLFIDIYINVSIESAIMHRIIIYKKNTNKRFISIFACIEILLKILIFIRIFMEYKSVALK